MKLRLIPLIVILTLILCAPIVMSADLVFTGEIFGDCTSGAEVTIRIYHDGQINTGSILETIVTNTLADGSYLESNLIALDPNTQYDINYTVTNAACSPGLFETGAHLNATTDGPIEAPNLIYFNFTAEAPFYITAPANLSTQVLNQTPFSWNSDYSGVTYDLNIATDNGFSNIIINESGIAGTSYTLLPAQELDDGTYYVRVQAINGLQVQDTSETHTFTVASHEAVISNPSPANYTWTSSTSQSVSVSTNVAAECRYATSSGVAYASKTPFSTTGGTSHSTSISLSGSDGTKTAYIQCNATSGVVNAGDYQLQFRLDTTAPNRTGATVVIAGGAAYQLNTTLDFTWSGFTDAGSGISSYYYSFSNGGGTSSGTSDSASPGQLTDSAQGTVTVYVWAVDNVGNIGLAASDSISVDSVSPSFTGWDLTPNDLTKYSTGNFRVDFRAVDTSGLIANPTFRYRIGNDSWSNWLTTSHFGGDNYYLVIPEQSPPNTWFERNGEFLYYDINATDAYGRNNNVSRSEFINNESSSPTINSVSSMVVNEDQELEFELSGSDPDYNILSFTCNLTDATITSINDTHSNVSWTPTNSDVGANLVQCNVSDGDHSVPILFTIIVNNVNDDPVLEEIGNLYAHEYVFFNYTLNASDPDIDDDLIYNVNTSMFAFNRITGKISFTPFSTDRGSHVLNFSVTDGKDGYDFEQITFTVGYCGDNVCRSGFEDCSVCTADCGACEVEETKAILLEARNCLNSEMTIEAVTLVERASCEEEGKIINNLEVCGKESDKTLSVLIKVDDAWEEVTQLVTDENGFASFTPSEEGKYRVRLESNNDIYTPFEVGECLGGSSSDQKNTQPSKKPDSSSGDTQAPILEEPTVTDEINTGWSMYAIMLYFVVIPLLFIILVVSAMGYWYSVEKNKEQSQYVQTINKVIVSYTQQKKAFVKWMNTKFPFLVDAWRFISLKLGRFFAKVSSQVIEIWFGALLRIGFKRMVKIPFYRIEVPQDKKIHLILVALLKKYFPKQSMDTLLTLILDYQAASIFDIAALLMSQKVPVTIVDPHLSNSHYTQLLVNKGAQYRRKWLTRVDIEAAIQSGNPIICIINEQSGKQVLAKPVVIYAFDQEGFYYHDYIGGKGGLGVRKDQFMKSYKATGGIALLPRKP